MEIAVIGLNHHTASTETREKVAFTDSRKIEAINFLLDKGIRETVILSTCNRSEIYIVSAKNTIKKNIEEVKEFYNYFFALEGVENYLYVKMKEEAVYHLYYVASGFDSIVVGEDQILGQVKDAHRFAMELGSSKKILNKLFREAVSTAKKIKTDLKISAHPLSISYIGVKFIKEKIGSFKNKNILIIGVGEIGMLALQYILEEEVDKIYMTNRSHQKVIDISSSYPQVVSIAYEDRYKVLKDIDVLITATASPHTVIKASDMQERHKALYILDMALPRDVDVNVGKLDSVHLYNLDDLKTISSDNEKKREALSKKAEEIIEKDVETFKNWLKSMKVDPVIQSLKEKCGVVEENTLEYIYRKIELDVRGKK